MRRALLLMAGLMLAVPGWTPPAKAETGFFESLRRLFGPRPRRRAPVVKPPPRETLRPVVTFAYAHHAGRYRRFRYSHHTPYGYYIHPYRHGFNYRAARAPVIRTQSKTQSQTRPRARRDNLRRGRNQRRFEYRFTPDGRIRRVN